MDSDSMFSSEDITSSPTENPQDTSFLDSFIETSPETIAIIDFLNLIRKSISDRPDAKFRTIDEFIANIKDIAQQIRLMGDFSRIYLVTKSFKFNDEISYNDILKIILWSFCTAIPEWSDRICLVLVNGINDKDKEADDRSLFILYSEFSMTTNYRIQILSNDNFESLKTHFTREVTLSFYSTKQIGDGWKNSDIHSNYKKMFKLNPGCGPQSYLVVQPQTKRCLAVQPDIVFARREVS